jgi:hypothetical protein
MDQQYRSTTLWHHGSGRLGGKAEMIVIQGEWLRLLEHPKLDPFHLCQIQAYFVQWDSDRSRFACRHGLEEGIVRLPVRLVEFDIEDGRSIRIGIMNVERKRTV